MAGAQQANQFNRRYPKKPGKDRFVHTQNTPYGMGDNYGMGVRAKLGIMRDGMGMKEMSPKKLKIPPTSVV